MNLFQDHPWLGTEHCLQQEESGVKVCANDHTGCLFNDGQNGCGHPRRCASPLLTKERITLNKEETTK